MLAVLSAAAEGLVHSRLLGLCLGLSLLLVAGGCGTGIDSLIRTKTCWILVHNESAYTLTSVKSLSEWADLVPPQEPGESRWVLLTFLETDSPGVDTDWWIVEFATDAKPGLVWWFYIRATPCTEDPITVQGEPGVPL